MSQQLNLIQFVKELKTIDEVTKLRQVGDHGPEKLELVCKCSVLKATGLVRTEKPCTDGLWSKEKSHSDYLNGLERSVSVGKNFTYGNECYIDTESRVEAMSRYSKKEYDYMKLAKK